MIAFANAADTTTVLLSAGIPALAAIIAAIVSARYGMHLKKSVQEVHVLVNKRLDLALGEIESLKEQKAELKDQKAASEQKIDELKATPMDDGTSP